MTPVTPQMLDAAYTYLEQLSSMVGMAPEEQVKAVLAQVYRLMDAKRPLPAPAPTPAPTAVSVPK
jgi:hypothetical protein